MKAVFTTPQGLVEPLEPRRLLSFAAPTDYPISNYAAGVTSADFNNDGRPDIASVSGGDLSVLLATPGGTFVHGAGGSLGGVSLNLAAGDFDGDGKADVVVTKEAAPPTLLLGNGDGSFGPPSPVPIAPPQIPPDQALSYYYMTEVAVADANADGKADALFGGEVRTIVGDSGGFHPYAAVSLGRGDGTFGPLYGDYDSGWGADLAVADVSADGRVDMVWTTAVRLGNGNGTFAPARQITYPAYPGGALTLGDFNRDGKPDIATSGGYVAPGNGNGTFQPPPPAHGAGTRPRSVASADVNGDGKPDLVNVYSGEWFNNIAPAVDLRLGNGDGTFAAPITLSTAAYPYGFSDVIVGDFSGDGRPDVAFAQYFSMRVLINDGNWATKTYVGPASGGNWATAANWSPAGAPTAADVVTIAGKSVTLSASATVAGLTLTGGASVAVATEGNRVLRTSTLFLGPDARINLNDNALLLDYTGATPMPDVLSRITRGRAAAPAGIHSPHANASGGAHALAVAEASDVLGIAGAQTATFAGQPVDATTVFIQYTRAGDANLDRLVDFADLVRVAQHYNTANRVWADADFTGDGHVDFNDLVKLAQNYNVPPPRAAPAAARPTAAGTPAIALAPSAPKPVAAARPTRPPAVRTTTPAPFAANPPRRPISPRARFTP